MKAWYDCEIACDCVKRANVDLHVGLCKEIFARKHTATHKPTSAQPLYSYQRDIHTRINRLWSPLAYGLGGNNSTTTHAITTIDTPLERSSHCEPDDEKYNAKPFQTPKIHGSEWRKSGSDNWNGKSNRSWSVDHGAAIKFVFSLVDSLDPCRHLRYTFQDVSSYHSNAVSEVAAASHARRSIDPEIDQLGHFKQL